MTIAAFIVALVGPVMARWLASMGMTLVFMTGLTAAVGALKSAVTSSISGMPAVAIQLGGLFGVWESIGIGFGAMAFCITWKSTAGFWALAKT